MRGRLRDGPMEYNSGRPGLGRPLLYYGDNYLFHKYFRNTACATDEIDARVGIVDAYALEIVIYSFRVVAVDDDVIDAGHVVETKCVDFALVLVGIDRVVFELTRIFEFEGAFIFCEAVFVSNSL